MADLDKVLCSKLWERWRKSLVEPDQRDESGKLRKRWRPRPVEEQDFESGKGSFLGFVDLTMIDDLGFSFKWRSLEAKILGGIVYVDFPSEKSDRIDPKTGKPFYYPRFFTKTPESRDLVTNLVFRHAPIAAQAEAAIARWNAAQGEESEVDDEEPSGALDEAGAGEESFSDDNPYADGPF
jgi:hypothetical protein